MSYTLIAPKVNKNAYKSLIASKYAGVNLELAPDFEFGKTNKSPEYLKMNPNGKVRMPNGKLFRLDYLRAALLAPKPFE